MTEPVFECATHGYYARAADDRDPPACPACDGDGDRILDGHRRRRLSTFCSGALRHFPDDAGLTLDAGGWTALTELVACAERQYGWADDRAVGAVVATDPKGRFERRERGDRVEIRAAYGHSIAVDLDAGRRDDVSGDRETETQDDLPETLYHGTAPRNLDAILDEGLKPMGRQTVHLSGGRETARTVGQRHADGDPVVLAVDVRELTAAGFDVRKRGVDTYTAERVPPECLTRSPNV
ncbi:RNA 2'-phosphotransferase [Salinigranum salinum]|uniref:RNA 2'-phosphotransferase n=1 Tax=Salinigranum salinum TaxID=1364937 RepID=UPI0012607E0D|nr:RNA 2'-phosphotransferase [Salinigranum salinum]